MWCVRAVSRDSLETRYHNDNEDVAKVIEYAVDRGWNLWNWKLDIYNRETGESIPLALFPEIRIDFPAPEN